MPEPIVFERSPKQRGSKATRNRLAKAEVLLQAAMVVQRWADYAVDPDASDPDPLDDIARRYGLTRVDMARICTRVADQIETKAIQGGYDQAWVD